MKIRAAVLEQFAAPLVVQATGINEGSLAPGDALHLRRQPDNEFDANALSGHATAGAPQLGWVPQELAATLSPEIDAGTRRHAAVLRETRESPRDPRTGLTMLLSREPVKFTVVG